MDTTELTETDIPGAVLNEPLENATVHALRWWLLCHGIQRPSSWKKAQLVECVRETKATGVKVVDVDGSYLYKKRLLAGTDTTTSIPGVPLASWEPIDGTDSRNIEKIPKVTHGLLYTYLAGCVGRSDTGGAFRSLLRGFNHWSSGRLAKMEINFCHPLFCHVRCQMTPSMKQGLYHVYILLKREGNMAAVSVATCECAAGRSASCTHVSALLHALAALTSSISSNDTDTQSDEETAIPVTSYLCQWNAPRKRKESDLPISEAVFQKHVYGRSQRKHQLRPLEDFDPRPSDLRGKTMDNLKAFLEKVRGQSLGVSLLFDQSCRCWSNKMDHSAPVLPSKEELRERVSEFKKSLSMPPNKLREIEQSTRDQSLSPLWLSVRQYRLTASRFGSVYHRKPATPPQALVLQILSNKRFSSPATEWGLRNEPVAIEKYKQVQNDRGHNGLYCCPSGFVISEKWPYLGASPDSAVHDPSVPNPFGLAEIKCPYSFRNSTPFEAAESSSFCCEVETCTDGTKTLKLKRSHPYYCQVQGQMAITERTWCDFVVYTEKGLNIERIKYNPDFWNNQLLPKLTTFYDNCLAPEIVCPVHVLGIPVRDLGKL